MTTIEQSMVEYARSKGLKKIESIGRWPSQIPGGLFTIIDFKCGDVLKCVGWFESDQTATPPETLAAEINAQL